MTVLELESVEVRYGGLVAIAPLTLTVPAVTPAPQPITSTDAGRRGTIVVRWPSRRCRRMS